MATFGNTNIETTAVAQGADNTRLNKFTLSQRGTISKLTIYLQGLAANQVLKGVIYDDDGASADPGTLLGVTNEVTVLAGQAAGWVDLVFATPVTLNAGDYWLGDHTGATGGGSNIFRSATVGVRRLSNDTYSDGPANPWVNNLAVGDGVMSVYATYEPPVGKSLALPYTVAQAVAAASRSLPYVIRVLAGRSVAQPYFMSGRVGKSLALSYNVRVFVGKSNAFLYTVRSAMGRSAALPYVMRTPIGRSLGLRYGVATPVPIPGKENADTYLDGASAPFGGATATASDLSIFATFVSTPWSPDPGLEEPQYGRLPYTEAQEAYGQADADVRTTRRATAGWYGTAFEPQEGSYALVRRDGPLADLVGKRLRVSFMESVVPRRTFVYVLAAAPLNDGEDISLARRPYLALERLSRVPVEVVIEEVPKS